MSAIHPGFKKVQEGMARKLMKKHGMTMKAAMMQAGRMLASASRNASMGAKQVNPNLKKVKG